jgi:hypothetical protein
MCRLHGLFIIPLVAAISLQQQSNREAFGSRIYFTPPAMPQWQTVQDSDPREGMKGIIIYKHIPILDQLSRRIEPVMALLYEQVPDSMDVIVYFLNKLGEKPYRVERDSLYAYPDRTSHPNSFSVRGHYSRSDITHTVYLAYFREGRLGVEIVADAAEEVFPIVEEEMRAFIKSVTIDSVRLAP